MTALLTLVAGDAALVIAPATGGAIASLTWRGAPVLRETAPDIVAAGDVRKHACYPLVPYSNRIDHGHLAFHGRTYELALNFGDHPHSIHGVGWQRPWQVVSSTPGTALLAYSHTPGPAKDDADRRAWPWSFRATQWFQLSAGDDGVALRMRLALANAGDAPFPFGLGWHPFFPCDAETVLQFSARGVWETDATIMPIRHVAYEGRFGFAHGRPVDAAVLDNVYTGWTGEAHVTHRDLHRVTTLRGDTASPFFVCYIPPHHAFMAIEPVTQMTDAFNRAERGEGDTGTRVLAPGECFSCTMEIVTRDMR